MIYFLQAECIGRIKIGFTIKAKVTARFAALNTASPVPLKLLATMPGGLERERELHLRFAHARVHGEWFEPVPELVRFVVRRQGRTRRAQSGRDLRSELHPAILEIIGAAGGRPVQCPEIAQMLGRKVATIRMCLNRLLRKGMVSRIQSGWLSVESATLEART